MNNESNIAAILLVLQRAAGDANSKGDKFEEEQAYLAIEALKKLST